MPLVAELTSRRLLAVLAQEQRSGRVPCVVAAMTRDSSLVWRGAWGEATGDTSVAPLDLQFRIGSITKTMTAVLVLQLRDEGRLALTHPLSAYLPELGSAEVGEATLRDLLAHRSGLPAEPEGPWWERSEGVSAAELLERVRTLRLPLEPGRTHHYSNLGYGLLGEVVTRVGGRSWWEQLSDRVLQPLGMLRTTYDPFPPHAQGYSVAPFAPVLTEEPATDTRAMAPAGQVWSTALDLATYADFLVEGNPAVLPPATLVEMGTPQSGTAADGVGEAYGLGLRLVAGGSGTLVGHTGSMPGFQAALLVDRVRRTGVAVLANSTSGLAPERLATTLLATLEELEPTVVDPWVPTAEVPSAVEEVAGLWHWGNTPLLLSWDGRLLRMHHATAGRERATFALEGSVLVGASGYHHGEPLEVVRRADGTVDHLLCSTFVLTRQPYDPT